MELFKNHEISNVIEYFYFKPVLAFQRAPADMFRAQAHLPSPLELRDTPRQSLNRGEFVMKTDETSLC